MKEGKRKRIKDTQIISYSLHRILAVWQWFFLFFGFFLVGWGDNYLTRKATDMKSWILLSDLIAIAGELDLASWLSFNLNVTKLHNTKSKASEQIRN